MKFCYSNRGSITLMLLVLLLPMLTFSGLMIDFANRQLAKAAAEQAGELVLNSALADYDSVLKETYGLFAFSQSKNGRKEGLQERLSRHYLSSLDSRGLIPLSCGSFSASPVAESNLAEPEVLETAIVEFMKYRGPADACLSLLDSLDLFKRLDLQAEVASQRMDVEAHRSILSARNHDLLSVMKQYDQAVLAYREAEAQLYGYLSLLGGISDSESEEYEMAAAQAEAALASLRFASPQGVIPYIREYAEAVRVRMAELEQENEEFAEAGDRYLEAAAGKSDSFSISMRQEYEGNANQFSTEHLDEILRQVDAAQAYLAQTNFDSISEYLHSSARVIAPHAYSDRAYLKRISEVLTLPGKVIPVPAYYLYLLSSSCTYNTEDSWSHNKADKGYNACTEQAEQEIKSTSGISYSKSVFEYVPSGQSSNDAVNPTFVSGYGSFDQICHFKDMTRTVRDLLSILQGSVGQIRNNLLLTEYVAGNFSCLTTGESAETLMGIPINKERNRIFGCETEYILFGAKEQEEQTILWITVKDAAGPECNLVTAKNAVFSLRFLFNSIFALTDATVDRTTLPAALSIQAASGGVIPYQLAQVILKLALAMRESSIDLRLLTEGEAVPLVKTSSTWQCSVGGMLESLRGQVTEKLEDAVRTGMYEGIGQLQQWIDKGVDRVESDLNDAIGSLSDDLETVLTGSVEEAMSSLMTVIRSHAERAFTGMLSKGHFDRSAFLQTTSAQISEWIQSSGGEIGAFLEELLPELSGTLLTDIADTIQSAAASMRDPGGTITVDEALYQSILQKINGAISGYLEQAAIRGKAKVQEMMEDAVGELKSFIQTEGEKAADHAADLVAGKTGEILDRFLPKSSYGSVFEKELPGVDAGLSGTILKFSYRDYLKLLLFLKLCGREKEAVLIRIADVIQMNVSLSHARRSGFRMAEAYTYLDVSAVVQTKSLLFGDLLSLDGRDSIYHGIAGY